MTPGKDIHYEITEYFTTGKIKRIESKTGYKYNFQGVLFKRQIKSSAGKKIPSKNIMKWW